MKLVNKMINDKCSRCGECCGAMPMPITRKEEKIIRKYIKEHNIPYQPSKIWKDENGYNEALRCVFYDEVNKCCKIYKVRPEMCRNFRCNMTDEQIENNKVKLHAKAYWNRIDEKGIHNITNFARLFYNVDADLYKWFLANLRTDIGITGRQAIIKALDLMTEGGIDVTKEYLEKLNKEMEESNARFDVL